MTLLLQQALNNNIASSTNGGLFKHEPKSPSLGKQTLPSSNKTISTTRDIHHQHQQQKQASTAADKPHIEAPSHLASAKQEQHQQQSSPPSPTAVTNTNKILILTGPDTLAAWVEQTKRMAIAQGCHDALLHHPTTLTTPQENPSLPPTTAPIFTEAAWHRRHHNTTAHHLVVDRLHPSVFAYMRVLGYNEIHGKSAALVFADAQRAAARMYVPESGASVSEEEVERFMWEWQRARPQHYPTQIPFDKARDWLGRMLVLRARTDEIAKEFVQALISTEERTRLERLVAAAEKKKRAENESSSSRELTSAVVQHEKAGEKRKHRKADSCPSFGDLSAVVGGESLAKKPRVDGGSSRSQSQVSTAYADDACAEGVKPRLTARRTPQPKRGEGGQKHRPEPLRTSML